MRLCEECGGIGWPQCSPSEIDPADRVNATGITASGERIPSRDLVYHHWRVREVVAYEFKCRACDGFGTIR